MSRGTLDPALLLSVSPTGLSPSLAGLSRTVPLQSEVINAVRTPECTHSGLGSFHFARRYFENRVFFLFLRLLRCFSSPGSLPYVMDWRMDTWSLSRWVSPFGYLRINGYLLLPAAFRSLSRPSSALSAKASTLRSFLFDLPVLLAFKTGGSLAVSFHRVYNVMSSYCFDSLSLKDNSSDVSFSYL